MVACVGGGSNAIGLFADFLDDDVRLIGVEAAGKGLDGDEHGATLLRGTPGILHGAETYVLQDADGQITDTWSVSAGLDYPAVGPEHAHLKDSGRARICRRDRRRSARRVQGAGREARASSAPSNPRMRSRTR